MSALPGTCSRVEPGPEACLSSLVLGAVSEVLVTSGVGAGQQQHHQGSLECRTLGP